MIPPAQVTEIRRLFFAEHWRVGTIAAQLALHPDTVRRALATDRFARPGVARPSVVDPYRPFLEATLQQYPRLRATRLFEMVRQRGYPGAVGQVRRAVRLLRPAPKTAAYLRLNLLPGEHYGTHGDMVSIFREPLAPNVLAERASPRRFP